MKIQALAPIYIGNGEKLGKKEYIYLPWDQSVIVPDLGKMYREFQKKHIAHLYQEYLLKNNRDDLNRWLKQQGYRKEDYQKWSRYEMDAGDALLFSSKDGKTKEILCFIKDAYGMPYVPGSSIKGMIRTAILAWEMNKKPQKYADIKREIENRTIRNDFLQTEKRTFYLFKETTKLETKTFHTLGREESKPGNAVNSNMSGLIVSDSMPIPTEQLTLCQKIDYTLDHKEKPLPILRECLMPGTDIYFEITIDEQQFPYTIQEILEALEYFQTMCYNHFYSRFQRGSQKKGVVWLGGGCGFLSKTVLYPLFGKEAFRITDSVLRVTLGKNYTVHEHNKDLSVKLVPHVCKCTYYRKELYDMGMGRIEILA